jgi:hypothetical protein
MSTAEWVRSQETDRRMFDFRRRATILGSGSHRPVDRETPSDVRVKL